MASFRPGPCLPPVADKQISLSWDALYASDGDNSPPSPNSFIQSGATAHSAIFNDFIGGFSTKGKQCGQVFDGPAFFPQIIGWSVAYSVANIARPVTAVASITSSTPWWFAGSWSIPQD